MKRQPFSIYCERFGLEADSARKPVATRFASVAWDGPAVMAAMKKLEPECTKSAPNLVGQCGKLLIVNAGEVAERLKAAVC